MRSALSSQRRQLAQICEACRQPQQRSLATTSAPIISVRTAARDTTCIAKSSAPRPPHVFQRRSLTTTGAALAGSSSAADSPSPTAATSAPQTHYDFFPVTLPAGPPPAGPFTIDLRALRREFLQLQAKAHPDLHPPHLKSRAEATSARINEAYKTLSSHLLRAQYLLSLRGLDVANDETAKVEDPELLMEVLEAREEIEEAQDEGDLEALRERYADRQRESVEALEQAFKEGGDLASAASEAVRLRYWVNIADSLHHWEKGKPVVLEHSRTE
jgi:molecular chaperone HscB